MNALRGLLPLGTFSADGRVDDRNGWIFLFERYPLTRAAYGAGVVYAFVRNLEPIYIGRAERLSERLSCHEVWEPAVALGATELWVHEPAPSDPVPFQEVEKRLIASYCPPLNYTHNALGQALDSTLAEAKRQVRGGGIGAALGSQPASSSSNAIVDAMRTRSRVRGFNVD